MQRGATNSNYNLNGSNRMFYSRRKPEALVIRAEQKLAVLEHRVNELEETPPKVKVIEQNLVALDSKFEAKFENVMSSIATMVKQTDHNHKLLEELSSNVNRLFWTGAGIALTVSGLVFVYKILIELKASGVFG